VYPSCKYTLLWSDQPLPLLSLTFFPNPPLFNSFQYISLYHIPSQMLYFLISLMLYHTLSFPPPPSSITKIVYF
jgi:hypothetical protein